MGQVCSDHKGQSRCPLGLEAQQWPLGSCRAKEWEGPKRVLLAVRGGQGQGQGRAWGRKGREEVSLAEHSVDWLWGRRGLQTEHRPHPRLAKAGVALLSLEVAG